MTSQLYAEVAPGGSVINIVQWDGSTSCDISPNTLMLATNQPNAQIGGTYVGGVFTAPATPPIPQGIIFLNSPASGATVNLPNAPQPQNILYAIFEPAAILATMTVGLPAAPSDGQQQVLYSTKAITAFTLTAASGQTIAAGAPTSLALMVPIVMTFSAQYSTWFQL
jgi:hypothetical protein